jgi:hypothetical protein
MYDNKHKEYVQQSLKTTSVEKHLNAIQNLINGEELEELNFGESFLLEFFRYKEGER